MDAETERHILKELSNLSLTSSALWISHRLDGLKNASHVLVLNQGQQEAFGTIGSALANSPTLREIWNLQKVSWSQEGLSV